MEIHRVWTASAQPLTSHGVVVISNNSPLEYLLAFALIFLVGALWAHLRCSNRDARPKEQAA